MSPTAAYVHIPFCHRRCFYCDFPVVVTGDRRHGGNHGPIAAYVALLCQEIRLTPALGSPLQTVFFGGGTPSLLTADQVAQILETLGAQFGLGAGLECSLEVDPKTFSLEQIRGYQQAGVNRFSLGVQAFQDQLLLACGRCHRREDIAAAFAMLQGAGVENWSLDLISGLPHQTLGQWQDSITQALALAPPHLSLYDLILEEPTVFGKRYQPGAAPMPSDEITAQMYRLGQQMLTAAGYDHYEVCNYAKPGFQCRHNRVYWQNHSYYGFGMGAASYLQGHRYSRPRHSQAYGQWVTDLGSGSTPVPWTSVPWTAVPWTAVPWTSAQNPDRETPGDTDLDGLLDTLMLGLRLREGVNLAELEMRFGARVVAAVNECVVPFGDRGWTQVAQDAAGQRWLRLTDPEGFLFSNQVLADLFAQLEQVWSKFGASLDPG